MGDLITEINNLIKDLDERDEVIQNLAKEIGLKNIKKIKISKKGENKWVDYHLSQRQLKAVRQDSEVY